MRKRARLWREYGNSFNRTRFIIIQYRTENMRAGGSIPSPVTIFIEEKRTRKCAFLLLAQHFYFP